MDHVVESSGPQLPLQPEDAPVYPPKYEKPPQSLANVWLRSIVSLLLFLIIGYYLFYSFNVLLIITGIIIFHELGHFFAMKMFRYRELGIFFIPLLGAYVSGTKREVSQLESAIISLAGPIPGIMLGVIVYLLYEQHPELELGGISFYAISLLLIFVNLVNLLPVYPLDGGQLLNRVFLDEEGWLSRIFMLLSIAFMVWFALYATSRPLYPLLLFPALMLFRMFGTNKLSSIEKKLEVSGINLDTSYEDLPDSDYWKIRDVVVSSHQEFSDLQSGPPYAYAEKEEKVMTLIQSLLHRHLIQDVSWWGKLLIIMLCVAAFATPWFLGVDIRDLLARFGF